MTVQAFNTAANIPQPYVFDFNREVAAFYRDHPEQKNKIFFISAQPCMVYRGDETDQDEVAALLVKNDHLGDAVRSSQKTGKGGAVRYDEEGYGCVILKLPRNQNSINLLGYSAPSDVTDLFSFDHEIGHLICPGGYDSDAHMKECVADAYAVVRHFQRFGADADSIKNLTAMRTVEMLLGRDGSHFTAPVVEKIIADSCKIDFSALTQAETAALAQRYAKDNAMNGQFISYIADHFNATHFNPPEILDGNLSSLRDLGAFILQTNIPEEFKWGATAVRAILDGDIGWDGICLRKPVGPEWTQLRKALDARAVQFNKAPALKLIVPGQQSI